MIMIQFICLGTQSVSFLELNNETYPWIQVMVMFLLYCHWIEMA